MAEQAPSPAEATPAPTAAAPSGAPPAAPPAPAGGAAPSATPPGPTLADGGGTEEPKETPANWPANWRDIMSGGDQKALQKLNRYASPANIWKAYRAIEQKMTTGELLRSKPDGTDEQALNEWRAQAGIPEKPEGYLEKLPNGLVVGEEDKQFIETFAKDMHDIDAPPAFVHKALDWYYRTQEKMAADRAEADKAHRAQSEDELRSEWGPEYRGNLNGVAALLDTFGSKEIKDKLFSARLADGAPLGDDPGVLKFLVGLSREINPHGVVTPTGKGMGQAIDDEIQKLQAEMQDTRNSAPDSYWKNEGKQKRYRELLELRDKRLARAS